MILLEISVILQIDFDSSKGFHASYLGIKIHTEYVYQLLYHIQVIKYNGLKTLNNSSLVLFVKIYKKYFTRIF